MIRIWAWPDLDAALEQPVAAHERLTVFVGISRVAKLSSDLFGTNLFAHMDRMWNGVNLRRIAEYLAFEPLVNNAIKLNVVVSEDARGDRREQHENQQGASEHRVPAKKMTSTSRIALRYSELNCHSQEIELHGFRCRPFRRWGAFFGIKALRRYVNTHFSRVRQRANPLYLF